MTQTYRTTDLTRWGVGKGSRLTATEADRNFWDIIQDILALQALDVGRGIDHFEVAGTQFYVHMSDLTVEGPFDLPVATFVDKGTWAPLTPYAPLDTFVINGGIYLVMFAHTSAASFDAGANDGMGHDYYKLMIQTPGNAIPTGGAIGQVIKKSAAPDFSVTWGWVDATEVTFTPVTGSDLASDNVADALEELANLISSGLGAIAVSDLTDVLFATGDPVSGELFSFDGSNWTAIPQADLSLSFTQLTDSPSVTQRRDDTVTALGVTGTVSLDPTLGDVFSITPTGTVTLNAASAPAGAEITVMVLTSGTSSFNITPTTNFKSQGALATGTVSGKTFTIKFVGNGTNLVEVSRTTAM
jgi:hypothetical protein